MKSHLGEPVHPDRKDVERDVTVQRGFRRGCGKVEFRVALCDQFRTRDVGQSVPGRTESPGFDPYVQVGFV